MNQKGPNGQKVAVIPGIFSGKHTARPLTKALERAGYKVVSDTAQADIVVAHSAGCFELPAIQPHQKLMLVNPPYWPGRTAQERFHSRMRRNFHFREYGYSMQAWLVRNLWGVFYAITEPRRTRRIMRAAPAYDLESVVRGRTVLLVRNEHDDWLTPDLDQLQKANPSLRMAHLPGDHDDINYNPKPYVDLLQSEL